MSTLDPKLSLLMILLISFLGWPPDGNAFRNAEQGTILPNMALKAASGKTGLVLDSTAKVNVFVFVRPRHVHSEAALDILAELVKRFQGREIHYVAVVSDAYGKKAVNDLIRRAKWKTSATLIDKGDVYYGKLGVFLHPSFGIADNRFRLLAYEPFSEINYYQRLEAQIEFALGDTDKSQLAASLDPPVQETDEKVAELVNLNFAKYLVELGKLDRALEQAKHALTINNQMADAYALIGNIYAKQKKCALAKPQFEKSLKIDQFNFEAKKGKKLCP